MCLKEMQQSKKQVQQKAEAEELMKMWFQKNCKPVTVQSAGDALQGKISKSIVQSALDALVEQHILDAKELKKAKVYFPSAAQPVSGDTDAMRSCIAQLQKGKSDLLSRLRALDGDVIRLSSMLSVDELKTAIAHEASHVAQLRKRVELSHNHCATESFPHLVSHYYAARSQWRSRKALVLSFFEMAESCEMNCLGDNICRPMDNVSLSEAAALVPSKYARTE